MHKHYSTEIAEAIRHFLAEEDWKYEFREEAGVFRFGVNLRSKIRSIRLIAEIEETDFNVYGLVPISADHRDERIVQQLARFLHRANYGLRNGNFELDFRDGEIRFKTYIECEGLDAPTFEMVRNSVYCIVAVFERYGDGLVKIMFADMDAETAIALCEDPGRPSPFAQGDEPESLDEEEVSDLLRMMQEMQEED